MLIKNGIKKKLNTIKIICSVKEIDLLKFLPIYQNSDPIAKEVINVIK